MTFIENLSTLTTLSKKSLTHLSDYIQCVHSHDIATQMVSELDNVYEVKLFEGTLLIQVIDDVVHYKFIPNEEFSKIVVDTILTKKSKLVSDATEKLKKVLTKAYKDVL